MTTFKLVPEPPDSLDAVAEAQRAVPLVPDSEADCCARLLRRCDLPSRDVARTWLTFLRALRLVTETDRGFRRLPADPTPDHLRKAFRERVYGAEALLAMLDDADPLSVDAAFERFRERVPTWERHKEPARWADVWRDRVGNLLGWLTLLGFAEERAGGYVRGDAS